MEPNSIMAKNSLKKLKDIDEGIDQTNFILLVNTIFTIIAGVAMIILAVLAITK